MRETRYDTVSHPAERDASPTGPDRSTGSTRT